MRPPEQFFGASARELSLLRALRPAYVVVDEAHCIDRWGRDLRPEYGRLGEFRERLGNPPGLAFTTTAGRETQARILSSLGVAEAEAFVHGANHPNISFLHRRVALQACPRFVADVLRLAEAAGVKAMVFVPARKTGEALAAALAAEGVPTPFYHGQLPAPEKQDLLQRFGGHLEPKLRRIICTNAFGMGVDIPDVRLVVHWQHFGEARVAPRRPLALRIADWVFARRPDRAETGACCDVCHGRRRPPAKHARFVCEALGEALPPGWRVDRRLKAEPPGRGPQTSSVVCAGLARAADRDQAAATAAASNLRP